MMPTAGRIVLYSQPHSPRFDGVASEGGDEEVAHGERPAIVNSVDLDAGSVELTVFGYAGPMVRHDVPLVAWRWPHRDDEQAKQEKVDAVVEGFGLVRGVGQEADKQADEPGAPPEDAGPRPETQSDA